jgi:ABC-type multidrug transport system ATPase subunit
MDEAVLCDRIALIEGGKILSVDTPDNTVKKYPGKMYAVHSLNMHQLLKDLRAYPDTLSCFTFGDSMHLTFKAENDTNVPKLTKYLTDAGQQGLGIEEIKAGIEDYFIRITETGHE